MATERETMMRLALEQADEAMQTWVATFAAEMCSDEAVGRAYKRIEERGGTLRYIGTVHQQIKDALSSQDGDRATCRT